MQKKDYLKRVFSLSSMKIKGSMALEGAFILPAFLFFLMTVLMCIETVRFQSNVMEALQLTGNRKAAYSYLTYYLGQPEESPKEQILGYLSQKQKPYLCVRDGEAGVKITDLSSVNTSGLIDLRAEYGMNSCIKWLPIGNVIFRDRYFGHAFIGYTGREGNGEGIRKEEYVYITRTGERYHKSRDCTHLHIKVRTISYTQIRDIRNQSGGKYYPCERCKAIYGGLVFITAEGTCYHSHSDCSSLKREVYMIPISEVGTYLPCYKCS